MTDEAKTLLLEEMNNRGFNNNQYRAALAAIIGGESHFVAKFETGYSRTANSRIRMIFGSRVNGLTDSQLSTLKSSDETFFNHMYGPQFEIGRQLGNTETDDGFKYRGGGYLQLTGRSNYGRYGEKTGVDLLKHPELVNTPRIAAATAVEYAKDRFRGTTFDALKACVGVSIGSPDDEKNRLYDRYRQNGEWDYTATTERVTESSPDYDPVVVDFLDSTEAVQRFLKARNLYTGPIDRDAGPGTRAALRAYLKSA